ncbi:hypothetical protein [Streptomyces sp. NRRL F-4489]|uniref:hypothetical protein n=1 Tax=Streptomyces sp. NRRL F-4489 TaxID=1609095 RepID=UPI003B63F18B
MAVRRPVAAATALVLVLEAAGFLLLNWILSIVVDRQQMSLAGLRPGAMAAGSWAGGAVCALFLLLCAAVLLRAAARDRAPGRLGRIGLICCAVLHGVLGAVAVGLLGWPAFGAAMVVLALLVLNLVAYGDEGAGAASVDGAAPGEGTAPGGAPA